MVYVFVMKKPILIPLISCSVLLGCHDSAPSERTHTQLNTVLEQTVMPAKWVGIYQGNTPCMTCISHCEDCSGMAVDLVLNADQSYHLRRERLNEQHEIEELTGHFRFKNNDQTQSELVQVKTRNLIYIELEQQILEILEDKTGHIYEDEDAFLLQKSA